MPHVVAIVDDDEAVRESTAALLRSVEFQSLLFESGDHFLMSDLANVSAILLDLHMPEMDGIEVLRQLGKRQEFPPVVLVTGQGDHDIAVIAMKLGATDLIEKPYESEHLLNALAIAVSNQ